MDNINLIKKLTRIANTLDNLGYENEAEKIDQITANISNSNIKIAQAFDPMTYQDSSADAYKKFIDEYKRLIETQGNTPATQDFYKKAIQRIRIYNTPEEKRGTKLVENSPEEQAFRAQAFRIRLDNAVYPKDLTSENALKNANDIFNQMGFSSDNINNGKIKTIVELNNKRQEVENYLTAKSFENEKTPAFNYPGVKEQLSATYNLLKKQLNSKYPVTVPDLTNMKLME